MCGHPVGQGGYENQCIPHQHFFHVVNFMMGTALCKVVMRPQLLGLSGFTLRSVSATAVPDGGERIGTRSLKIYK